MSYLNIKDILSKKLDKESFTTEEIKFIVHSYRDNLISDSQMAAIVTSIYINGCNDREVLDFTNAVIDQKDRIDLHKDGNLANAFIVDKHSTGGIGDKISLIFAPILKAFPKLYLMKISGRALGHSGGTIDKLESFKNFRTNFNHDEAMEILKNNHSVIMESNANLLKTEKKIYTLRDEIGVVSSPFLIVPSIMSKKLVFNTDLVILDIKTGSGSLLNHLSVAEISTELAGRMLKIAKEWNRNFIAVVSNMDIPLGNFIGNDLEVYETIMFLSNQGEINPNLKELVYKFVSIALIEAGIAKDDTIAHQLIDQVISSGAALAAFKEIIIAQEGSWVEDPKQFIAAKNKLNIVANNDGFIDFENLSNIGIVVEMLGGTRNLGGGEIDHSAGIEIIKHQGHLVKKGDVIATLYSNGAMSKTALNNAYYSAVVIQKTMSEQKRFPKNVHNVLYSKNY